MNISEIKKLLDRGDYIKIARIVGYKDLNGGRKYVYRVLSGKITGNKGIAKKIVEAAQVVALRNIGRW